MSEVKTMQEWYKQFVNVALSEEDQKLFLSVNGKTPVELMFELKKLAESIKALDANALNEKKSPAFTDVHKDFAFHLRAYCAAGYFVDEKPVGQGVPAICGAHRAMKEHHAEFYLGKATAKA